MVHDGITGTSQQEQFIFILHRMTKKKEERGKKRKEKYILRKHINDTPPNPPMADPAHPLLGDSDMPRPRRLHPRALSHQQLSLCFNILRLLQVSHDTSLAEKRGRSAHATTEVKLEVLYGERLRNEAQCGVRRKPGAVFGEHLKGWAIPRLIAVGRGQIEREQGEVDRRFVL